MNRKELEALIFEKYSASPEFLFADSPDCAVFRHVGNRKWFAIIMRIPISKLGVMENRSVNIVNFKLGGDRDDIWEYDGIFPAYHMNKRLWISVLLDGSVPKTVVEGLLDDSYYATSPNRPRTNGVFTPLKKI